MFGLVPKTVARVWGFVANKATKKKVKLKHLFWTLRFLKSYSSQDVLGCDCGVSRPTLQKWLWVVIRLLNKTLPKVSRLTKKREREREKERERE